MDGTLKQQQQQPPWLRLTPGSADPPIHPGHRLLYERSFRTPFELLEACCASTWSNYCLLDEADGGGNGDDDDDEAREEEKNATYLRPWMDAARLLCSTTSSSASASSCSSSPPGDVFCWARAASRDGADLPLHDALVLDGMMSQQRARGGVVVAENDDERKPPAVGTSFKRDGGGQEDDDVSASPSPRRHRHNRGVPEEFFRELIGAYPDGVRHMNCRGRLPLHVGAASGAKTETLRLLLRYYPQTVRARDGEGRLPLHLACIVHGGEAAGATTGTGTGTEGRGSGGGDDGGGIGEKSKSAAAVLLRAKRNIHLLLDAYPAAAGFADDVEGALPAHLAARSDFDTDTLASLLEEHTDAILTRTDDGETPRDCAPEGGGLMGFLMFLEDEIYCDGKMLQHRASVKEAEESKQEEEDDEADANANAAEGEDEDEEDVSRDENGGAPQRQRTHSNLIPPDSDSEDEQESSMEEHAAAPNAEAAAVAAAESHGSTAWQHREASETANTSAFQDSTGDAEESNAAAADDDDEKSTKTSSPKRGGINEHGAAAPCACDGCAAAAAFATSSSGGGDEDEGREGEDSSEGGTTEGMDDCVVDMVAAAAAHLFAKDDDGGAGRSNGTEAEDAPEEGGVAGPMDDFRDSGNVPRLSAPAPAGGGGANLLLGETPADAAAAAARPHDDHNWKTSLAPCWKNVDPKGLAAMCACDRCAAAAAAAAKFSAAARPTNGAEMETRCIAGGGGGCVLPPSSRLLHSGGVKKRRLTFVETVHVRLGVGVPPGPEGRSQENHQNAFGLLRADATYCDGDDEPESRKRQRAAEQMEEEARTGNHPTFANGVVDRSGMTSSSSWRNNGNMPDAGGAAAAADPATREHQGATPLSYYGEQTSAGGPNSFHGKLTRAEQMWNITSSRNESYVRRIETLERTVFETSSPVGKTLDSRVTTILTAGGPMSLLKAIERAEELWEAAPTPTTLPLRLTCAERIDRLEQKVLGFVRTAEEGSWSWAERVQALF